MNTKPVGAIMVVGGGIAGIQASLDLAESGFYVYLWEKSFGYPGRMDPSSASSRILITNPFTTK